MQIAIFVLPSSLATFFRQKEFERELSLARSPSLSPSSPLGRTKETTLLQRLLLSFEDSFSSLTTYETFVSLILPFSAVPWFFSAESATASI